MGIFVRLKNLVVGFFSLFVSGLEQSNPEIAYQNTIESLTKEFVKARGLVSSVVRRRTEISQRLAAEEAALEEITLNLEAAVTSNEDDIALLYLEKKEILETDIKELKVDLVAAEEDSDNAKDVLNDLNVQIRKIKAEKDRMLAKFHSAKAKIKIREQIDGLSADEQIQTLDGVRDHIKNTIAESDLVAEMNDSDIDNRLKKVRKRSGNLRAQKELEKLKAAKTGNQKDMVEFEKALANTKTRSL